MAEPIDLAAIRERVNRWRSGQGNRDSNATLWADVAVETADALLAHIEAQQRRIASETGRVDRLRGYLAAEEAKSAEEQSEIDRLRELLREALKALPTNADGWESWGGYLRQQIESALSERPE